MLKKNHGETFFAYKLFFLFFFLLRGNTGPATEQRLNPRPFMADHSWKERCYAIQDKGWCWKSTFLIIAKAHTIKKQLCKIGGKGKFLFFIFFYLEGQIHQNIAKDGLYLPSCEGVKPCGKLIKNQSTNLLQCPSDSL